MKCDARFWIALAAALPALACAATVRAEAETATGRRVQLDQGFVLNLPEGWTLEDPGDNPGDATGRLRVRLVCGTPACKRTQESCSLSLRRDPVGTEGDDTASLDGLYASPMSRYSRIRQVLKSTSRDATLRGEFGKVRLGPRSWWSVETEAAHRFKSGLFAETVIDGRYLGATCKTCETDDVRHEDARAMLAGVRRSE